MSDLGKSPDEHLETVQKIRDMKKRNPDWLKFFTMGFFMASKGENPFVKREEDVRISNTAVDVSLVENEHFH